MNKIFVFIGGGILTVALVNCGFGTWQAVMLATACNFFVAGICITIEDKK